MALSLKLCRLINYHDDTNFLKLLLLTVVVVIITNMPWLANCSMRRMAIKTMIDWISFFSLWRTFFAHCRKNGATEKHWSRNYSSTKILDWDLGFGLDDDGDDHDGDYCGWKVHDLVPKNFGLYTYFGSLTTPPPSRGVNWQAGSSCASFNIQWSAFKDTISIHVPRFIQDVSKAFGRSRHLLYAAPCATEGRTEGITLLYHSTRYLCSTKSVQASSEAKVGRRAGFGYSESPTCLYVWVYLESTAACAYKEQ